MSVSPCSSSRGRARRLAVLAVLALGGATLTGCGEGAFVDRRRDAAMEELTYRGDSTPDAPSICYNTWKTTPAAVQAMADAVCAKSGRVARLVGQTKMDCRLFYPARANFVCVDPGTSSAEYGVGIRP